MKHDDTQTTPPSMSEYAMAKKEMEGYPDIQVTPVKNFVGKEPQLIDRLFAALSGEKEFQMLSMDAQGEICVALHRLILSGESKHGWIKKD